MRAKIEHHGEAYTADPGPLTPQPAPERPVSLYVQGMGSVHDSKTTGHASDGGQGVPGSIA